MLNVQLRHIIYQFSPNKIIAWNRDPTVYHGQLAVRQFSADNLLQLTIRHSITCQQGRFAIVQFVSTVNWHRHRICFEK